MNTWTHRLRLAITFAILLAMISSSRAADLDTADSESDSTPQYLLVNVRKVTREVIDEIRGKTRTATGGHIRLGVACIYSYLARDNDEQLVAEIRDALRTAEQTDTPIYIQIEGEVWWQARPDLWNWWEPDKPGFDPRNRQNVEWSSWDSCDALKIAWLDWGRQMRMVPPPNLMSPRYRAVCHEKMRVIVPEIVSWWKQLPESKKDLFVGLKVGWESAIGVGAYYYPDGNTLLDKPAKDDPTSGRNALELPARGVSQIGFAAVKTAGIRSAGEITEADLAEVIRRHLDDLCHEAAQLGVPRDRLFTHCGGWAENELLYRSALNPWSCPGWSFYAHAADPMQDSGVRHALSESDAPCWAATEWLCRSQDLASWQQALETTLSAPKCRLICIYNWWGIEGNAAALKAIEQVVSLRR